jgi:hypothetical protein
LARSRIWPIEALTTKSFPRYPSIVLAFAGDSTMTRCFGMDASVIIYCIDKYLCLCIPQRFAKNASLV